MQRSIQRAENSHGNITLHPRSYLTHSNQQTRDQDFHQHKLHNTWITKHFFSPSHHLSLYEKKPSYIGAIFYIVLPVTPQKEPTRTYKTTLTQWLLGRPFFYEKQFLMVTFTCKFYKFKLLCQCDERLCQKDYSLALACKDSMLSYALDFSELFPNFFWTSFCFSFSWFSASVCSRSNSFLLSEASLICWKTNQYIHITKTVTLLAIQYSCLLSHVSRGPGFRLILLNRHVGTCLRHIWTILKVKTWVLIIII